MSAPRSTLLPFLYPVLSKPQNTRVTYPRFVPLLHPRTKRRQPAHFHTSAIRLRYGKANEPPPHLKGDPGEGVVSAENVKGTEANEDADKKHTKDTTAKQDAQTKSDVKAIESVEGEEEAEHLEEEEEHTSISPPSPSKSIPKPAESPIEDPETRSPPPPARPDSQPLETVLHMPSPADITSKAPHMKAPPYVHHFDTYGLVKHLEESGFKQDQSISIMKAVRAVLTENMNMARDGLVSKSNVENESYLFRAAVSELRTEIQNNRKGEMEKMRTERTQLQHEVDILNQRFSQESGQLKDELKGLFDDRRMAVRMEQKVKDNQIQELNYKITVSLNSDARSEVEGLRWLLTRRAATALAISAVMILATLRYSTYMTQTQEKERKEMAQRMADESGYGSASGNGSNGDSGDSPVAREVPVRVPDDVKGDGLIVSESGGKGYVSLG